jgi:hypothetical protein
MSFWRVMVNGTNTLLGSKPSPPANRKVSVVAPARCFGVSPHAATLSALVVSVQFRDPPPEPRVNLTRAPGSGSLGSAPCPGLLVSSAAAVRRPAPEDVLGRC